MFGTLYKLLTARRPARLDPKRRPRSLRLAFDVLEDRLAPAAIEIVTNTSDGTMPPARGLDLRQALALTNTLANAGSTINFSVSGPIVLAQGELTISQPVTIDATGQFIAIDGAGKTRVFFINTPFTVTLTNLTIKDGIASTSPSDGNGNGGGIYDASSNSILVLNNDIVELNSATTAAGGGNGGGVYSNGVVTLNGTTVDGNSAPGGDGGGIYAAGNTTLNSSIVSNNISLAGGGIYQAGTGTTVTLNQSSVIINKATAGNGGGVWALFNVVGNGGLVANNLALGGGNGGGIYSDGGNVTLAGTAVTSNTATGQGGGIWADFNIVLTGGANVSNNVGDTGGGGLWADDGFVKISATTVSGNTAGAGASGIGDGGGIWSGTDVTILDALSSVTGNTANGNGGGIFALRTVKITGAMVSMNNAVTSLFTGGGVNVNGLGGGIYAGIYVTLAGGAAVTGNSATYNPPPAIPVLANPASAKNGIGGIFVLSPTGFIDLSGGTDTGNEPQP